MARWISDEAPAVRLETVPALSGPDYKREQHGIVAVETRMTADRHRARCDGVLMAPVWPPHARRSCGLCGWSPDDCDPPKPPTKASRPKFAAQAPPGEFPTVTAVPGCETMFEEWQHRGINGVSRWKWDRETCQMRLKVTRPDMARTRAKKGRHELDIAWRKENPGVDRFLARCEIAGRVLRRWAVTADVQHLELPDTPGSLTVGQVVEWSADEILEYAEDLVSDPTPEEAAA